MAYNSGDGVPRDDTEAAKWLLKAAEQGDSLAQRLTGLHYYNGKGVTQDWAEAVKWFRKSAEQGDGIAQQLLGECYEKGRGVVQDYVEAYKWYNLAAVEDSFFAAKARDALAQLMTRDQIAEGQRAASQFVPRRDKRAALRGY
jgi:hypothetical protein